MTPGARIAAAIEILDRVLDGAAAEQILTTWGRRNRFAGSGDRAAIRDHVFDALRCRRSFAALGGAMTGRGVMIGAARAAETDPATLFTGEGHAPEPLSDAEQGAGRVWDDLTELERLDCPDWIADDLRNSLGEDFAPVMAALRDRAPVFLRVNRLKSDRAGAAATLLADGIGTRPHALADTALEVVENARRIRNSVAYRDGLVELQDASSQALVAALPPSARVLDYCAGGGGKALAIAAAGQAQVFAHDANPARMADLPPRAARAGVEIPRLSLAEVAAKAPFDVVLCDAPCSGTGAWRRQVQAKWTLDAARLAEIAQLQSEILDTAQAFVAPGGTLAYATCSLLARENEDQVTAFCDRRPGWTHVASHRWTPITGGDGFGLTLLQR